MVACGWVRTRECKCALKCAHVCRCALGLYHHRDNKLSRVICKLSGENFPAEALITFLLQLKVPKNTKSQSQLWRKAQTWSETITYSVGLCCFFFFILSQTDTVFICQSQLMHPVCSIQLVCFTQTKLDVCTNLEASRWKKKKTQRSCRKSKTMLPIIPNSVN